MPTTICASKTSPSTKIRVPLFVNGFGGCAPFCHPPYKNIGPTYYIGKMTKSGIPGWFLNKTGYHFFRDGARLRTSAKRLQNAFWRLNPLRLVCAQHPKPFFRCSTPQNSANDGAQKVLSTNNPILFRNTPGIPCPVLRFYKPPDFVHTAPDFVHTAPDFVQFCKTRGDTETDISPQPSTEDLWPKIFHTTGKLPTVTTVMQPQQHC